MRYPIAIEPATNTTTFGVVVPDLPGCFSAGDTVDDAIANAEEAILLWLEEAFESNDDIPEPRPIERYHADPEFVGWIWAMVNVDASEVMGPAERINITVPKRALAQIDSAAARAGESRSSFLVNSALRQANANVREERAAYVTERARRAKRKAATDQSARGGAKKR